ncbi:DUF3307 domain-containing protein [Streptococcus rifensis]
MLLVTEILQHPVFVALLSCHFLSDYHLQNQSMADQKEKDKKFLTKHLGHVFWPLLVVGSVVPSLYGQLLLVFISHALIDFLKPYVKKLLKLSDSLTFTLDQLLHIAILFSVTWHVLSAEISVANLFLSWTDGLRLVLFFLMITKPANVAFRVYFSKYQPAKVVWKNGQIGQKKDEHVTMQGAGATIGNLERIVMGICIIFGQFASIGLVFTAKSIARYNKISEDPAFAEYYLIGSLFSILSVLIASWLCFII